MLLEMSLETFCYLVSQHSISSHRSSWLGTSWLPGDTALPYRLLRPLELKYTCPGLLIRR